MSRRYLNLCPLDHALELLTTSFPKVTRKETISLIESPGRVVAAPVYARYSVPEVNLAAMDGFAVRSRDTVCADDQNPLRLDCTFRVNTGNIVPPKFDAVIMIEDIWMEESTIRIRKPAIPWQHIRLAGEDIKEGQLIVPEGHLLRPFDIGALATYGVVRIDVRTVNIGLVPTGGEACSIG